MEALAVALGIELRSARLRKGWTRVQLVRRLPVKLSTQTIATYEFGTRHMPVKRLYEICETLDERVEEVLTRVRARLAEQDGGEVLYLDLSASAKCRQWWMEPLSKWARIRLKHDPTAKSVAVLSGDALEYLAAICGTNAQEISAFLRESGLLRASDEQER
jgi:transcriptional regulator with XRE-family HTH domain